MKRNKWILIGLVLVLLQAISDGLLHMSVYCCLFPILFIILTLPYRFKTLPTMLMAFFLGILADLLGNGVLGLNAAALTAVAFCRQGLLRMIAGPFIMDNVERPNLFSLGYIKIIGYSALCSLIYLTVFILVENGGLSNFIISLCRILISTIANCVLMTVLFSLCGQRRRL